MGSVRPRPFRAGWGLPGQAAPTCRPWRPMRAWSGDVMPRPDPGDESPRSPVREPEQTHPRGFRKFPLRQQSAASPHSLARATTFCLLGCPRVTSPLPRGSSSVGPPFISTRDLMFSSSFPQVCPHPPGMSHVTFSPPVPPRTPKGGPQPHFHVRVLPSHPRCVVAKDVHLFRS